MLDGITKSRITEEYRINEQDTGSTEVQVAVLTERIRQITDHLRIHKKDVDAAKRKEIRSWTDCRVYQPRHIRNIQGKRLVPARWVPVWKQLSE